MTPGVRVRYMTYDPWVRYMTPGVSHCPLILALCYSVIDQAINKIVASFSFIFCEVYCLVVSVCVCVCV